MERGRSFGPTPQSFPTLNKKGLPMKRVASSYEHLKTQLKRFEGFVDFFQFLLSAIAVTLVIANEFVLKSFMLPYIDVSWPQFVVMVRAFTWMVFVFDFAMYGLAS